MKTIKIWEVTFGRNWSSYTVKARNYTEAGRKIMRKYGKYVARPSRYISKVKLICEAEE